MRAALRKGTHHRRVRRAVTALAVTAVSTIVLAAPASGASARFPVFAGNPSNGYATFQPYGDVLRLYDTRTNGLYAWLDYDAYDRHGWWVGGGQDRTGSALTLDTDYPEGGTMYYRVCEGSYNVMHNGKNGTRNTCGGWGKQTI